MVILIDDDSCKAVGEAPYRPPFSHSPPAIVLSYQRAILTNLSLPARDFTILYSSLSIQE